MSNLVRYAEFRRFRQLSEDANNATMGLLAGSKLAANTLSLTTGSTLRLSEIFPSVPHITRFDLRTDRARSILNEAELHLSRMAVPYVLAIHEDYMSHCCSVLTRLGVMSRSIEKSLSPKVIHAKFAAAAGATFNTPQLEAFQILRTMRNCQVHEGGRANSELVATCGSTSPAARRLWRRLTRRALPDYSEGDDVALEQRHLITCLAITRLLAEDANRGLQRVVPSRHWAEMAVSDALAEGILNQPMNHQQVLRKLKGFVRHYYGAARIPEHELTDAARGANLLVQVTKDQAMPGPSS